MTAILNAPTRAGRGELMIYKLLSWILYRIIKSRKHQWPPAVGGRYLLVVDITAEYEMTVHDCLKL